MVLKWDVQIDRADKLEEGERRSNRKGDSYAGYEK